MNDCNHDQVFLKFTNYQIIFQHEYVLKHEWLVLCLQLCPFNHPTFEKDVNQVLFPVKTCSSDKIDAPDCVKHYLCI